MGMWGVRRHRSGDWAALNVQIPATISPAITLPLALIPLSFGHPPSVTLMDVDGRSPGPGLCDHHSDSYDRRRGSGLFFCGNNLSKTEITLRAMKSRS